MTEARRHGSDGGLRAIVRRPPRSLDRCVLTHIERKPIDVPLARFEHRAYVGTLAGAGVAVLELPPLDELPDSAFVEDVAVVLGDRAVLTRSRVASRMPEARAILPILTRMTEVVDLPAGAFLDGGDVIVWEGQVRVGVGSRTDSASAAAFLELAASLGFRGRAMRVRGALHLKTAMTALGDGRFLVNPDWVDLDALPPATLVTVDPHEPFAANVLSLGSGAGYAPGDIVLVAASEHPRTNARLESAGFDVRSIPLGQFALAEAGPTCLCILLGAS